jgi:hypothetical protein
VTSIDPKLGTVTHCSPIEVVPWYDYASSNDRAAGRDHLSIVGVRNDDRYQTKIGFLNASEYSTTLIIATLHNGAGAQIDGAYTVRLAPLGSHYQSAEIAFPSLRESRLNRIPPINSPWIRIEQTDTVPTRQAYAYNCADGCPAFMAWGDLHDRASESVVVQLGVEFDVPPPLFASAQKAGIVGPRAPGLRLSANITHAEEEDALAALATGIKAANARRAKVGKHRRMEKE